MNLDIYTELYTPILDKPVSSSREDSLKSLKEFNKDSGRKLICVDGTKFSDKIIFLSDENIKNIENTLLLPAGIDGTIVDTKEKVELVLPVGDCGLLVSNHKDLQNSNKILGNAHLGYKGVISDGDLEKNGIIENFLDKLKEVGNSKDLKDFDFYMAPMAGNNFELPKSYFFEKIAPFIEKQNKFINTFNRLDVNNFIENSFNKYDDGIERVYFDLSALISYILINRYNIFIPENNFYIENTTNPKNRLSSFRSHTLAKNIPQEAFEDEKEYGSYLNILKIREEFSEKTIEIVKNLYKINREQALILLNSNAEFYKNINSRLSLNIFTDEKK